MLTLRLDFLGCTHLYSETKWGEKTKKNTVFTHFKAESISRLNENKLRTCYSLTLVHLSSQHTNMTTVVNDSPKGGKSAGVKIVSTKPPGGQGIIRPRKEMIGMLRI